VTFALLAGPPPRPLAGLDPGGRGARLERRGTWLAGTLPSLSRARAWRDGNSYIGKPDCATLHLFQMTPSPRGANGRAWNLSPMVDILESSQSLQKKVDSWFQNRRRGRYMRVLRLAVRPERDEYFNTLKLAFAGLLVLGLVGFAIQYFMEGVTNWLGSWLRF